MKIGEIIRVAVIKTNPYWPFSVLNKIPYYVAIKVFIISCKKFPQIKSVYLRHGLTESKWVPGLSDIDLTVIIDSKLDSEQEYYFLKSFWKRFHSLKKFFPIIGEVDIIDDEKIDSWTKFTIRGYESRFWKLIYGSETVKSNYIVNQERLALDSLNHAITNYTGQFLPKFYSNEKPKYLLSEELHRLTDKIRRYSTKYDSKFNGNKFNHGKLNSQIDMICCIIKVLEENVKNLITLNKSNIKKQEKNMRNNFNGSSFDNRTIDSSKLDSCYGEIECMLFSNQRNFIILKDDLDPSTIKHCLEAIQEVLSENNNRPIIISYSTFNYMIRYHNPYTYEHLKKSRRIIFGKDLLTEVEEPYDKHFIKSMLDQVINVLPYPQSYTLFSTMSDNWLKDMKMDMYLDRFLFLKLFLEKAITKQEHKEFIGECQKQYPNYYKNIDELKNNPDKSGNCSYSIEWFRLLKDMANDIHSSLCYSRISLRLFKTEHLNYSN